MNYLKTLKTNIPPAIKPSLKRILYKNIREAEKENKRIRNLPRFVETEVILFGKKIKIVDNASFLFLKKELFDAQIYKFQSTNDSPYILDCGANIGLSVIYFKQLYPNAEIVAFEPDEKVFNVLSQNIKSFKLRNVKLVKKACWNEEMTLKFYSEGSDGGRAAMKSDTDKIIEVETIRLRHYLNRKIDFLKIDIEGAENKVIGDIQDMLFNVERIFVEYHSFKGQEQLLPEILGILKAAGFRLIIQHVGIYSPNPLYKILDYNDMDLQLNIFGYRL